MSKGDNEIEETPEQVEAAAVAMEKWEHYNDTYVPVENEYMSRVDDMDSEWQHDMAAGNANKAYKPVFDDAAETVAENEMKAGADPSSGRFIGGLADVRETEGTATSAAKVEADQHQETRYAGGVRNIVNVGQGVSTDAQMGLQDVANRSASDAANEAISDFRTDQSNRQLVGMAAGAGLSYGLNNKEDQ